MEANLDYLYKWDSTPEEVTKGMNWYPDANSIMREWAEFYQYPIATVAGITAAVSPQLSWERNLIVADDILAHRAISVGGAIRQFIDKAREMRDSNLTDTRLVFKSAPKVYNFSLNLAGDYSGVTVDAHAAQAALADPTFGGAIKGSDYAMIAQAYSSVAKAHHLEPAMLQAIIWLAWKRMYPPMAKRALTYAAELKKAA